jgi:hypothetical protein
VPSSNETTGNFSRDKKILTALKYKMISFIFLGFIGKESFLIGIKFHSHPLE